MFGNTQKNISAATVAKPTAASASNAASQREARRRNRIRAGETVIGYGSRNRRFYAFTRILRRQHAGKFRLSVPCEAMDLPPVALGGPPLARGSGIGGQPAVTCLLLATCAARGVFLVQRLRHRRRPA